ncbi:hypothetical protein HFN97_24490 [Rhizobium laguerreae]|nr:hypothetical protein [Rhizobium laguerreae]MBY5768581.1 hypothetical protein [Rhizobium leguminosarum]
MRKVRCRQIRDERLQLRQQCPAIVAEKDASSSSLHMCLLNSASEALKNRQPIRRFGVFDYIFINVFQVI